MSLNVSIDDVPFAILEMVKARILAQRQKQQQAKPTAPKGPRPQFRRFGASSKAYRMPRPAALPDAGEIGFVLAPSGDYVNGELEVIAEEFEPMVFSNHLATEYSGVPLINFDVTDGPTVDSKALFTGVFQSDSLVTVHGFAFASSFASDELLDMKTAGQPIGGLNMRLNFHDSFPSTNETITELPELLNPDARAGLYDSYTFEFICQPTSESGEVSVFFNNLRIDFYYFPFLPAVDFGVNMCGIETVSTTKGELDTESNRFSITITSDPRLVPDDPELSIEHLPLGTWSHVAFVKNDREIGFYLNGVLMFSAVATQDYWDRASYQLESLSVIQNVYRNGDLPLMTAVTAQTINASDTDGPKVHGLRFTPEALYTGASFSPPQSITELA